VSQITHDFTAYIKNRYQVKKEKEKDKEQSQVKKKKKRKRINLAPFVF
jgi:uncharacterized protein YgiM (DUF1202 family)